jgi:hypothetical protein
MTIAPRFCTTCGSPIEPGSRFCHTCGAPVEGVAAQAAIQPAAPAPVAQPQPATQPQPVPQAQTVAQPGVAPPVLESGAQPGAPTDIVSLMAALMIVVSAIAFAITLIVTGIPSPRPQSDGDGTSSGGRQVIDVQNIRAEVPAAWDVLKRSGDTIAVDDRSDRTLWLRSASVPSATTVDAVQQRFLDKARGEAPDARICAGPETALVPGGPSGGRYVVICSTFIPQGGGPAVPFADAFYIGLDGTATTVFVMQLTATPENLQGFATTIHGLPPPGWKLFHQ